MTISPRLAASLARFVRDVAPELENEADNRSHGDTRSSYYRDMKRLADRAARLTHRLDEERD